MHHPLLILTYVSTNLNALLITPLSQAHSFLTFLDAEGLINDFIGISLFELLLFILSRSGLPIRLGLHALLLGHVV